MNTKCVVIRATLVGILALLAGGCRSQQELTPGTNSLTGILYVTGNEPFTELSVQSSDGQMHVIRKDTTALYSTLRTLQGKKVRLILRSTTVGVDTARISVEKYDLVTDR